MHHSIASQLVTALAQSGRQIATAESCTGGRIASAITSVPGSSAVFAWGVVSYANAVKSQLLHVRQDSLTQHGAVSAPVAKQMAEGALSQSGADIAIATSGIAGPEGGSAEKPVGLVWFAVAQTGKETRSIQRHFTHTTRQQIQDAACLYGLTLSLQACR